MDTAILRKAGLTESQAKGYLALIEHGALTPVELAEKTGESRTNGYAIADKLVELGLAIKEPSSVKTSYKPANPVNLKKLLLKQQQELKQANEGISALLPQLSSKFNIVNDQPGTLLLEGISGLNTLYEMILKTADSLSIIPSDYDRIEPEISREIDHQIDKQLARGITTRALYPADEMPSSDEIAAMQQVGVEVRPTSFHSAAQIIIFGQSVAMSTFRQGMITSVITHPDIAMTLQAVFDKLWDGPPTV